MTYRDTLFHADAARYTPGEAAARFVPNAVWERVRVPRTQIIYGSKGSGKTMVLLNLSWSARRAQASTSPDRVAAFYIDMRDLEGLNAFYTEGLFELDVASRQAADKVTHLVAGMVFLSAIALALKEVGPADHESATACAAFSDTVREFWPQFGSAASFDDVAAAVLQRKATLISDLGTSGALDALLQGTKQAPTIETVCRAFADKLRDAGLEFGLLLDQYEALQPECQTIFNSLLRRENHRHFFVVIGSTPFSVTLRLPAGSLRPGQDFVPHIAEYMPDEHDGYRRLLIEICQRLLPHGVSIDDLLESGIDYFAHLSSRSVRRFLELCETAGAFASSPVRIGTASQIGAGRQVALMFRDQLKVSPVGRKGALWELILQICSKAASRERSRVPSTIRVTTDELYGLEYLSGDATSLVRKGFEEGAFLFKDATDSSSLSLPDMFLLAPIIGPAVQADVVADLSVSIDKKDIEEVAKGQIRARKRSTQAAHGRLRSLFLSISFADLPEPRVAERLFTGIFREEAIDIVRGQAIGGGMIPQLADQIAATNATILELSHLRPNLIVELGITLGLGHRVIPALNVDGATRPELDAYPFLQDMGYLPYSLSEDSLREFRQKVIDWMAIPVDESHILERPVTGNVRLRVQPQRHSVGVYFPESRRALWLQVKEALQTIAANAKYDLAIANLQPHAQLVTLIDQLIWTVSRSERLLIDTSGKVEPDLYGAFALGFAFALARKGPRRHILRTEEQPLVHKQAISMWPAEQYVTWRNPEQLLTTFRDLLRDTRRKRR
jgi:hypothetical protein